MEPLSCLIVSRLPRGWAGGQQAHLSSGPLGFAERSSTASLFLPSAPCSLYPCVLFPLTWIHLQTIIHMGLGVIQQRFLLIEHWLILRRIIAQKDWLNLLREIKMSLWLKYLEFLLPWLFAAKSISTYIVHNKPQSWYYTTWTQLSTQETNHSSGMDIFSIRYYLSIYNALAVSRAQQTHI